MGAKQGAKAARKLRSEQRRRNPSRLLCLCAPAGQEEFFTLVGQPVATRTEAPSALDADELAAFIARSQRLAPEFKTELLSPPGRE